MNILMQMLVALPIKLCFLAVLWPCIIAMMVVCSPAMVLPPLGVSLEKAILGMGCGLTVLIMGTNENDIG